MKNYITTQGSVRESTVKDYIALLKPRVMSLVVFTAFAGMVLAPGHIHPFIAFLAMLFITIGAGAAGCLNMWYDRDIDAIMQRTQNRPIVRGSVNESEALALGIMLSVFSVVGMGVCVNILSGFILFISIIFYYYIYTVWLKRVSVQNIVIGGAAGAFPPMIGWTATTGNVSFDAFILFLIIFLWTPAHFWALALYKAEDYKLANIPMMPVIRGKAHTKDLIVYYTILTLIATILPYLRDTAGVIYLITSIMLNLHFLYLVINLRCEKDIEFAPKVFVYSIFYLFALFLALIIDKFI